MERERRGNAKRSLLLQNHLGALVHDICTSVTILSFSRIEASAKAAAAEREQELQKQELALTQKQMERSFQVNIQELKAKMETDRKNLLEEQKKMMDSKLKVMAAA